MGEQERSYIPAGEGSAKTLKIRRKLQNLPTVLWTFSSIAPKTNKQEQEAVTICTVSYTHLTLPTKRIV